MRKTRKEALLALAFAGGLLNSQLPGLSQSKADSPDSLIQQIANNVQTPPESRAFYLLRIASAYMRGEGRSAVNSQFGGYVGVKPSTWADKHFEMVLVSWSDDVASGEEAKHHTLKATPDVTAVEDSRFVSKQDKDSANDATQKALMQLDKVSNKFAKLHLYFIASRLLLQLGDADGVRRCNTILENAFHSAEKNPQIDIESIKAASSVLDSMSKGVIYVTIPTFDPSPIQGGFVRKVPPFTDEKFKESERLKLRACAILDRLNPENQLRWQAHRELTLWYMQLGKMQMAEHEKQILFKLVGFEDDSLLYAQVGACGHLLWWQRRHEPVMRWCGMG